MITEKVEIEERLSKINACIAHALPANPSEKWLHAVFSTHATLSGARALLDPCRELLNRGGKRWRPLLAHLVCESLGGGEKVLPLVPLLELCHNASLIHDDIEDNSAERRGKPAVHLLYGADTAINSGSFLYILPLISIDSLEASASFKLKLYSLWASTMRRLHLGQSFDIDWHKKTDFIPSFDDYYLMCSLKTGVLARFATELGALSCSVDDDACPIHSDFVETLGTAAEKFGAGFQILDDVRNLSTGISGKERGDDLVEGKMSLPVLLFLHKERGQLAFVQQCFTAARKGGVSAPEVDKLIDTLRSAGALEESEKKARVLLEEAQCDFRDLPPLPLSLDKKAAEQACAARRLLADFTKMGAI
ncbi:MAG: polyprenyl synthetase family protein [Spirochaetaceae bacterium]|jgi:octaprenyl-diphosphate synthase|nr:polyprenyl synthetase family protein [Spirochaetaceae bacterium]